MKKTDKKIDNALISALTAVCEQASEEFDGFKWLTHLVNYRDFPRSLVVVCVFDTNEHLARARNDVLRTMIRDKLASIDVPLADIARQVRFDTEEK